MTTSRGLLLPSRAPHVLEPPARRRRGTAQHLERRRRNTSGLMDSCWPEFNERGAEVDERPAPASPAAAAMRHAHQPARRARRKARSAAILAATGANVAATSIAALQLRRSRTPVGSVC